MKQLILSIAIITLAACADSGSSSSTEKVLACAGLPTTAGWENSNMLLGLYSDCTGTISYGTGINTCQSDFTYSLNGGNLPMPSSIGSATPTNILATMSDVPGKIPCRSAGATIQCGYSLSDSDTVMTIECGQGTDVLQRME